MPGEENIFDIRNISIFVGIFGGVAGAAFGWYLTAKWKGWKEEVIKHFDAGMSLQKTEFNEKFKELKGEMVTKTEAGLVNEMIKQEMRHVTDKVNEIKSDVAKSRRGNTGDER